MGFDVFARRCPHNVILGTLEHCPQCVVMERQRAVAQAGPKALQVAEVRVTGAQLQAASGAELDRFGYLLGRARVAGEVDYSYRNALFMYLPIDLSGAAFPKAKEETKPKRVLNAAARNKTLDAAFERLNTGQLSAELFETALHIPHTPESEKLETGFLDAFQRKLTSDRHRLMADILLDSCHSMSIYAGKVPINADAPLDTATTVVLSHAVLRREGQTLHYYDTSADATGIAMFARVHSKEGGTVLQMNVREDNEQPVQGTLRLRSRCIYLWQNVVPESFTITFGTH